MYEELENYYYPIAEIIPNTLATWGAGDYGYNSMNDTYTFNEHEGWPVVDCRDMIDGSGNPLWLYEKKIDAAISKINQHGKVLICCMAGMSRSNSIAAGVLMKKYKMDYIDAIGKVQYKVEWAFMDQAHLNALKKLFGSRIPFSDAKVKKV